MFIVERRDRHRFAGTHSGDWRGAYYSTRCFEWRFRLSQNTWLWYWNSWLPCRRWENIWRRLPWSGKRDWRYGLLWLQVTHLLKFLRRFRPVTVFVSSPLEVKWVGPYPYQFAPKSFHSFSDGRIYTPSLVKSRYVSNNVCLFFRRRLEFESSISCSEMPGATTQECEYQTTKYVCWSLL